MFVFYMVIALFIVQKFVINLKRIVMNECWLPFSEIAYHILPVKFVVNATYDVKPGIVFPKSNFNASFQKAEHIITSDFTYINIKYVLLENHDVNYFNAFSG